LAKVISLAFRLFGNMLSGTVLLSVLMVGLWSFTSASFGVEFPIIAPIILIAQGLLVACIQALVFPLLLAIYVKVARMGSEEEATA
jgi:F0F1-type ATP synthase membrane subunit a